MPAQIAVTYVDPRTLVPSGYNPREIEPAARQRLADGIRHFGFVEPLVVRTSDNMVIGGHQRLDIALQMQLERVPVVFQEMSDDDAMALNVLLNNPEAQGRFNLEQLAGIFDTLTAAQFDVSLTGYDADEVRVLIADVQEQQEQRAMHNLANAEPPESFQVVDETIPVQHRCPRCHYEWSGNAGIVDDDE